MHDEFERAVTGRTPRRGLSPVGWVLLTFGVFALVGTVGAGVIAYKVATEVREGIGNVTRELGVAPDIAAARIAARLASVEQLVSMDPERGLALLSDLDGADRPAELLRAIAAPLQGPGAPPRPDAPEISSQDGAASFRIDSDEGSVRLELVDGDEGGRIRIVTDDGRVEAAFGEDSEPMPGWVDDLAGAPARAQPVISLDSDRGRLGAVAWEADEGASALLGSYLAALEAAGYEVKAEHRARDGAEEQGSLWARNEADGRMIFVVAHRDDHGRTGVLMGYGEER